MGRGFFDSGYEYFWLRLFSFAFGVIGFRGSLFCFFVEPDEFICIFDSLVERNLGFAFRLLNEYVSIMKCKAHGILDFWYVFVPFVGGAIIMTMNLKISVIGQYVDLSVGNSK